MPEKRVEHRCFGVGKVGLSTEAQSPEMIVHLSRSWHRWRLILACLVPEADVGISFLERKEEEKKEEMMN